MSLIVEVNQGKLIGKEQKTGLTGKPYFSFQGIPYAKPPLGELRFQAPLPAEKWQGMYDATYDRERCIQPNFFLMRYSVYGSEDCLYLNVYTPQPPVNIKTLIPVMILIHGGEFAYGSGTSQWSSPDNFLEHDIIMVTFNFRMHVLGFLNLGIPECPGNAGLKDQQLALKWVKENIANFGGDSENITIFGYSSGSSSAQLHTLSPLSKGLFQKAILQSTSTWIPWVLTRNPYEKAFMLGAKLGFNGVEKEKLLDFLKQQKADDLTETYRVMRSELNKDSCAPIHQPFCPSVEAIKDGAFLPNWPSKLLETADPLPIIYGANSKEGMVIFMISSDNVLDLLRKDLGITLREAFDIKPGSSTSNLTEQIMKYYFGDKDISSETADEITNLYNDIYFHYFNEAIETFTKYSWPVYVYEFAYEGSFNDIKQMVEKKLRRNMKGSCHADEIGYLFYQSKLQNATKDDLKVIFHSTSMWTNFAKTGNPSSEFNWIPYSPTEPSFLRIDSEPKLVKRSISEKQSSFLKNLLNISLRSKIAGED